MGGGKVTSSSVYVSLEKTSLRLSFRTPRIVSRACAVVRRRRRCHAAAVLADGPPFFVYTTGLSVLSSIEAWEPTSQVQHG